MKKAFFKGVILTIAVLSGWHFFNTPVKAVVSTSSVPYEEATSTPPIDTEDPENSTTTPSVEEETPISVNFNLRYGSDFIFQQTLDLTGSTTLNYMDNGDSTQKQIELKNNTVLSALLTADTQSERFDVYDITYYPSYDSYLVNCLKIDGSDACYNWQYAIDDQMPMIGMDKYVLNGEENVYVYFGNNRKLTASTSSFPLSVTTTFQSWKYDYDNTESEWEADPNAPIQIIDSDNNVLETVISGENGQIDYVFTATGTYRAKIHTEDYSKWSDPISLTVLPDPIFPTSTATSTTPTTTPAAATSTLPTSSPTSTASSTESGEPEAETPPADSGEGGDNYQPPAEEQQPQTVSEQKIQETVDKILAFLKQTQEDNGRIVDGGISDWSAISFAADNQDVNAIKNASSSLLDFIKTQSFTDTSDLNDCASYSRHLLALYSAGINKEDDLIQNLANKIKNGCNGEIYGLPGINDDIFALLAILAIDESYDSDLVNLIINTIKEDQNQDGAFTYGGYAGADMTGAAINTLKYAQNKGLQIDEEIFDNAKDYLKNTQLDDGGWGYGSEQSDVLATSWAVMGLNALGEGQAQWFKGEKNPWHVLTDNLNEQGYYESTWSPGSVDWFAQKHAVPSLLGLSWPINPPCIQEEETSSTEEIVYGTDDGQGNETENEQDSSDEQSDSDDTDQNTTTTTAVTETDESDGGSATTTEAAPQTTAIPASSSSTLNLTTTKPTPHTIRPTISFTKTQDPTPDYQSEIEELKEQISITNGAPQDNQKQTAEELIDSLPLDTPTKKIAKKMIALGGGLIGLGLYLGFKLIKKIV